MKSPWTLGLSLCLSLAACGDSATPTPAADAGSDVAVTDVGSPSDVAADAGRDVPVMDLPASDVPATDVPATDVPATDVPATDVPVVVDAGADVFADRPASSDVPVAEDVQPGRGCGGRGGSPCPDGQFCDFPISSICGAADGPGTCRTPPAACTDLYDPVCGCDGTTYSNGCDAAANRVSVSRRGACTPVQPDAGAGGDAATRDCRSTGCSGTSSCQACLSPGGVVYACIPSGAAC
jgi:hypothetical protein